jgi:pheophorbide a oxygenase
MHFLWNSIQFPHDHMMITPSMQETKP